MSEYDLELDTSGLNCPLPILRAKKALADLSSGQLLHLIATDPGSMKDFQAFSRQTGHGLESATEDGGVFHFVIRKA